MFKRKSSRTSPTRSSSARASNSSTAPQSVVDTSIPPATPEKEEVSSSGIQSDASTSGSSENSDIAESPPPFDDDYCDIRRKLESLSRMCRNVHVTHTLEDVNASIVPIEPPDITFFAAWTTYLGYAVLIFVGHIRELCSKIFHKGRYLYSNTESSFLSDDISQYAPLLKSFENFYTKRLYHRIQDCFNRPISSNPGANIQVLERISFDGNKTMELLGSLENLTDEEAKSYRRGNFFNTVSNDRVARKCLNLGSYNYLGFGDDWNITCKEDVMASMADLPVNMASCRMESGTSKLHEEVEEIVAEFLGKEASLVQNMGFNTNATAIPALMGRGDLIVSDELNHTSIVNGARASGSAIRAFRHNDTMHLEEILKEAIVCGQPRTRRPWKKIMVIVEGIYSMEGEYCDLRGVVEVCKKYGAYVYLDEAHSVGAMGATGRGCAEYTEVNTADIDVMMGTFTKSFGGMGGYIAANKDVIDMLRTKCAGNSYHNSLSPVVCQQVITSFKVGFLSS